jgi:hypothetical protein
MVLAILLVYCCPLIDTFSLIFGNRINVFVTLGLWGVELMIGKEEGQCSIVCRIHDSKTLVTKHKSIWADSS